MSVNVSNSDILDAVAYLRCFHDRDDEGLAGFAHVDPRTLSLVLAGLVLANVTSMPCADVETYLDHLTAAVRRRET